MTEYVFEVGCADGWRSFATEVNGECAECGTPTIDGDAAHGCYYSPETCEECGHHQCDQSC